MVTLHAVGYGAAAAGFAAFAVLLVTRWRLRMRGSRLLPAMLVSSAWATVNALVPADASFAALLAEIAKPLAWMLVLSQALGGLGTSPLAPLLRIGPYAVASVAIVLGVWIESTGSAAHDVLTTTRVIVVAGLTLALAGFVLVEQALRNTRGSHSWDVKFLWVGAGALFAYDIALYSASYALGSLQLTLYAARGFAVLAVLPLLAFGVTRASGFQPQVFMSQRLAYYTSSLLIAGVYLLGVSVMAYYVRAFGGSWGEALQVVLIFVALLGLATVLLSRTARARLRVVLAKHVLPYKFDYRSEWLDLTARLTLDPEGSSLAQRTLEAFVHLARATSGGVFVLREEGLQLAAGRQLGAAATVIEPAASPFCRFLEANEWIVDLDRARRRVGRDAEMAVPGWLMAIPDAWLAISLVHERKIYALVVLQRPLVPQPLTWEDLDLLRTGARQAASYFALEHSAEALARERQFAALNRFTAFLMHDLSNIVAQQRLIVENAGRHKSNPAFVDDAVRTIDNTVQRMSRLLEQLKAESAELPAPRRLALADICRRAVEHMADRPPQPTLGAADGNAVALVAGERLEHVLEHLIRNAQDATPPDGSVVVSARVDGRQAVIDVTDTGQGMTQEFVRDRLFRPFDTTKGANGIGIGAFQAREFVRASGGEVVVRSVPGAGTSFVIRLPLVS